MRAEPRPFIAEPAPAPRLLHFGALAGVVAPILCASIFVIAARLRPGYSSIRQYGSDLALGQNGWLQTANFILVGLLLICFALALQRGIKSAQGSKLGPALVGVYGLGWVLVGVFHGALHQLSTDLFVALPLSCLAIAPRLAADEQWKGYVRLTVGFGIVGLVFSAGWYVHHIHVLIPHIDSWIGLYQRVFYAELLAWIEIMALHLFTRTAAGVSSERSPAPALAPSRSEIGGGAR
jgi:hypothetical membrane protein